MDNRAIGMFDSGVGGITVFSEIKKILPRESIIYLGDTKRFPYGNKSKESIIEISRQCVNFLINKNVKVIIIACGTATSQSIEVLKKEFNIPIIGIIGPTVKSIKNGTNKKSRIGVIATQGTIKSKAWENELIKEIPNVEVVSNSAPLLATMAECGWTNNKVAKYTIKEYMKLFKKIDKLILGCTHYPLFQELIEKEVGHGIEIINTGKKIAEHLEKFLKGNNIENNLVKDVKDVKDEIYLTDVETGSIEVVNRLISKDVLNNIKQANF